MRKRRSGSQANQTERLIIAMNSEMNSGNNYPKNFSARESGIALSLIEISE